MIEPSKDNIFYRIVDFIRDHMVAVIAAVIIVMVVLGALINHFHKSSGEEEPAAGLQAKVKSTYRQTSTVYLPMSRLRSLKVLSSKDTDTYYIAQLICSSLFRLDSDLNVEKDLVKSYHAYPGQGKVSMTLRKAAFSNGNALNADDVKYTVSQIKKAGSSSPYYTYAKKIKSVSGSGSSVEITFSSKKDAALDNLTFPIVDASTYESGNAWKPAGSGQYKISSVDSGRLSLVLKPNTHYYGTKASNTIHFHRLPNQDNVSGLVTTDAITGFLDTSQEAFDDASDKNLKSIRVKSPEAEYIAFQFKNAFLKKRSVRQAICYAIDCKQLIDDDFGSHSIQSDSIYFPGFLGTENKKDKYVFNQSKAILMLRKAGYEDRDQDGLLEDSKGKHINLTLLVNQDNKRRAEAAQSVATELKNIGINVTVKQESSDAYQADRKNGSFDLLMGGYVFDKSYNLKKMFDKGNELSYYNKAVASEVEKLEETRSAASQKEAYVKLKDDLNKDVPYYCICYKTYSLTTVKNLKSSGKPVFFSPYRTVSTWSWKETITPDTASDTYKKS